MLVFVDESGDPGVKGKQGTSKYFVVTAILFEDHDQALKCDRGVHAIRERLGWHAAREFHFAKCAKDIREQFLREAAVFHFFFLAIVVDKCKLRNSYLLPKETFYNYAVRLVFENAKPYLTNAIVVLDKSGGLGFRQQLASYLKKKIWEKGGGKSLLKKVKMQRSHSNNLLQLADMVCGAVARSFREDKADRDTYRRLLKHLELNVTVWPK